MHPLDDTVVMLIWSQTEGIVTIICACIPVLRPLYVQIRTGTKGENFNGCQSYPLNEAPGKDRRAKYNLSRSKSCPFPGIYTGNRGDEFETSISHQTQADSSSSEESTNCTVRAPNAQQGNQHPGSIQMTTEFDVSVSYSTVNAV